MAKPSVVEAENSSDENMSSVVYLGRVPEGFVERDMWRYFKQFGKIRRLKLYRSKKTGKSKGFAFIQFLSKDVAKIVASTMNNYLMFEKILKCHVLPRTKVHENLFKNWKLVPNPAGRLRKLAKAFNGPKTSDHHLRMLQRLEKKIRLQNAKLTELGINYSYPIDEICQKRSEIRQKLREKKAKRESTTDDNLVKSEIKQEIVDDDDNDQKETTISSPLDDSKISIAEIPVVLATIDHKDEKMESSKSPKIESSKSPKIGVVTRSRSRKMAAKSPTTKSPHDIHKRTKRATTISAAAVVSLKTDAKKQTKTTKAKRIVEKSED